MVLMAVCGVLVLAGLVCIVRWGGLDVEPPWVPDDAEQQQSWRQVGRRYVWNVTVAVAAGIGSGILLAGGGGRLAMRLLAATAGDAAQGQVTEADEVVGTISTGGTIGFVVFTAVFFGAASGALYMLLRRWLPRGRIGGLAFGTLLLIVAATRIDPLRADNPDFGIVGPGWLSAAVFASLVVAHGMLVSALAGRYSCVLPLLERRRRAIVAHAPILLLGPIAAVLLPLALIGVVAVVAARARALVEAMRSRSVAVGGRVVLATGALGALPGFVASVVDIIQD